MRDAILKPVGFAGQVYREGMEAGFAQAVKASDNPPDLKALAKAGVIAGFGTGKAAETETSESAEGTEPTPAPKEKAKGGRKKKS